jgi:3-oxoacyl-(acyl-carrier-protein) synthase/pimeloyl-ACP methyl ester carboxylesterase/acyl carrier protein
VNIQARFIDIAKRVRQAVSQETKIPEEQLRDNDAFESFGIESVLSVAIVRRLEETFGELSKTLLFEYQTIDELVGFLATEYAGDMHFADAAPSDWSPPPAAEGRSSATMREPSPPPVSGLGESASAASAGKQPARGRSNLEPVPSAINEIAIIGISGRFPQAGSMEQFWENLATGRDCIEEISPRLWDWRDYWHDERGMEGKSYAKWGGFIADSDCFDPLFFNISNLQASAMDPQERLFLETVHHTLEDAGYTRDSLRGSRVGLYVSAMWGSYQHYGARDASTDSSFASIANRASWFFDFRGPSIALDTTCSGSLTTVHLACESLRMGETDLAIAGGVNVTSHPHKYLVLSRTGFASADGRCRSFGADGSGYVPGDGVGALLLKPLASAVADGDRIHAVIKATCINHGGRSSGFTVPSAEAQAALIEAALRKADVDPRSIGYVEAHAPGTALGDPIEVRGLTAAFRKHTDDKQFCAIGSVKSNIGHLESAAGFASLAKVVLQLRHRKLVPSIHSASLNPNIQFENTPFYVQRALAEWPAPAAETEGHRIRQPRRAAISAFGAGGSNAHAIVEEHLPLPRARMPTGDRHLIVLSAKTPDRLRIVVENLLRHLRDQAALSADRSSAGSQLSPEERILGLVSELARVRPVLLDHADSLQELFGESRGFDALLDRVQNEFGIAFAAERSRPATIGELVAAVSQRVSTPPSDAERSLERLEQIAYTLQVGREAMPCRLATLAQSVPQLQRQLEAFLAGGADLEQTWVGTLPKVAGGLVPRAEEEDHVARLVAARRHDRLGRLWCSGVAIPWSALYAEPKPARIALPLYPFARERCWVEASAAPAPEAGEVRPTPPAAVAAPPIAPTEADAEAPAGIPSGEPIFAGTGGIEQLLFRPEWSVIPERSFTADSASAGATGTALLIYPRSASFLAEALRPLLPSRNVYEIVLGSRTELLTEWSWEVDIFDPGAIARCLTHVDDLGTVYFLGGWHDGDRPPAAKAAFDILQEQGVKVLFRLVRTLHEQAREKAPRLKIVCNRTCAVGADDRVQPFTAGVPGFARAVMREYPQFASELIDLDVTADHSASDLNAALRFVVNSSAVAAERAVRGGQALRRKLRPYALAATSRPVFKRDGVYLLIGGAGSVGSRISRSLARSAAARLVWTGRRGCDDAISERIGKVERLGGQVKYMVADASDVRALERAIDEIEREYGRIDGVLHLAMTHAVTRIGDLTEEQLKAILAAKADSTYALRAALRRRDVGFVALFSSAEANIGNIGWSAYAAACSFQDVFALDWAREAPYPVLAVNWGYWQSDTPEVGEMLAVKGIRQISAEQGLAILELALANRTSQLTALDVADHVLTRMGIEKGETEAVRPMAFPTAAPSPGAAAPRAPAPLDGDGAATIAAEKLPSLAAVSDAVTGLLASTLRIDKARLELDVDLLNYGLDSLIVVAVHKSLEKITGPLPATLFINFHTIKDVGEHLLDAHPAAARALCGGSSEAPVVVAPPEKAAVTPSPGSGGARLLHAVGPSETMRYLESYGAAYRAGEVERAVLQATPCAIPTGGGSGLMHAMLDTQTAGGVEVFSVGAGIPVLMLPAVGLTAPTFRHQLVSTLPHSMRLSVPHPPGYGMTKPIRDCSTRGVAGTFKDVIDLVAPGRPVHLVASCLGCVSAIYLARNLPERIASLTLIGAFYNTSDMLVADPDKLSADELTNLLQSAVVRIKDDFAGMQIAGADAAVRKTADADFLLNNLCANSLVALRYLTEMLTLPVFDWLAGVRVPTQCIYGTSDKIVNPLQSRAIADAIPGASLVAIEGAGHFPYLTHSEQLNPLIERFVLRHERASSLLLH